ncbi:hypothetical protein [Bifidobacterium scardovii]|uniref:Sugar ABC transporter permease n=2 Tax=Bifidobacterium scardovii TaxID=158787 RepID=A0A087DEG4_9BIFI|nr:hypothetical protein [Bifidobacterium scardovii]KFI93914.1 hypothetical protein BSCA_2292 [Bifidobacterium scardovii]MDK6348499.1 hypothetical protein [Bifidobacterium scardovii]MDU8981023.1 hypothetical protein [Bifidobacterium scardovii]BAQ32330.1 hypothetical protein BBSC_2250 [Bifidobacterium scardovii JCM 12489 = DSM 13734]
MSEPTHVSAPAQARDNSGHVNRLRNRNIRNGLLFIAPNFIGFFFLVLIPVVTLFYTSFTK